MTRLPRRLAWIAAAGVLLAGGRGEAQTGRPGFEPAGQRVAAAPGSIQGIVVDERGAPLKGATVSAFGTTMAYAVTGEDGRFVLAPLPVGAYSVRAERRGFGASRRELVSLPGPPRPLALTLRRLEAAVGTMGRVGDPEIVQASLGVTTASGSAPVAGAGTADRPADDHGETAWRLRHLRRSVLKDTTDPIGLATEEATADGHPTFLGRALESPVRLAAVLFADSPLTGQFNLVTTSAFDSPADLFGSGRLPTGVAHLTLGAPAGRHADWTVIGALTQGDVSSWLLAGSYRNRAPGAHRYEVGLSYSTQRYEGGNPAALSAVTEGGRNVGALFGRDEWQIAPRLGISYGAKYAWHDYLDGEETQVSPSLGLTILATERTRIVAGASERHLAPGAEEFLPPPVAGLWLPPERTFSTLVPGAPFRAERTRHVEVGIEHDLDDDYTVGVRRFFQDVDDQLVTIFGVRVPDTPRSDLGHYHVSNAGNLELDGWTITVSHALAGRVKGSVGYTLARARWAVSPEAGALAVLVPAVGTLDREQVHDVTTSVETLIPETATRLFVLYKVNSTFTRPEVDAERPGPDARFDVQVHQALPFLRSSGSQWEVLVAVRNLFREWAADSSAYDELLVVRPPKRVVGGLTVRF
jgi:hypothetical protein